MGDLRDYIAEAPLCMGLNGKGCLDYKYYTDDIPIKLPNKYRAVLVDYKNKRHYYDEYCESCRFKNNARLVCSIINSGKNFRFNQNEFISSNTRPFEGKGKYKKDNYDIVYCDTYISRKRKRDEDEIRNEKRRKLTEEKYRIEASMVMMEHMLKQIKDNIDGSK